MDPNECLRNLLGGATNYSDLEEWLVRGGFSPSITWGGGRLKIDRNPFGAIYECSFKGEDRDRSWRSKSLSYIIKALRKLEV